VGEPVRLWREVGREGALDVSVLDGSARSRYDYTRMNKQNQRARKRFIFEIFLKKYD